jgi:CTP:molybdopterin cytidylyltransferase MocA
LRHPERVTEISLTLEEASDVDTPDDLVRVRRAFGQDGGERGS